MFRITAAMIFTALLATSAVAQQPPYGSQPIARTAALPADGGNRPLSLTPKAGNGANPLPPPAHGANRSGGSLTSIVTTMLSLGLVLAIFLTVAWMLRKSMPTGGQLLPAEVVESLGRTPLAGRQQAHLLRLGNKLILVAVSPGGAETLVEIDDPVEVDRLAGLCRQSNPHSATNAFKHVFQQFGRQRVRGFLDDDSAKTNAKRASDPDSEVA